MSTPSKSPEVATQEIIDAGILFEGIRLTGEKPAGMTDMDLAILRKSDDDNKIFVTGYEAEKNGIPIMEMPHIWYYSPEVCDTFPGMYIRLKLLDFPEVEKLAFQLCDYQYYIEAIPYIEDPIEQAEMIQKAADLKLVIDEGLNGGPR